MDLKRILTVMTFAALLGSPNVYGVTSDSDLTLNQWCVNQYKGINDFLQYLYRVDGNLNELNPSKIKRIKYLESVFEGHRTPKTQRRAAFKELHDDPDWWIFKLQRNSKKLIGQLETLKKDSDWEAFKKLATQQANRQIKLPNITPSATRSMLETVEVIYSTANYFNERIEIKERLDALGANSRLMRAFSDDPGQDSEESTMFFYFPRYLLDCQINFLANRLQQKP